MRRLLMSVVVALGMAGMAHAAAPAVQITDSWVREVPPVSASSAAFFTLHNTGKTTLTLTGLSSPAASAVELHEMSMAGGLMRMNELKTVTIPAGGSLVLVPGEKHLMLIGLKAPLKAGQQVPLTLHFRKAGSVQINAVVRADSEN